jgi:hypothetical protein
MSLIMFWLATFDNTGSAHSVEERISFEIDVSKTSQLQTNYVPPSLWTISTLRTDAGHVQHIASHMFKVPEPMFFFIWSIIWNTFECWSPQWLNFFKNYTLSELVCSLRLLLITNYIQCNPLHRTAVFDKLLMDDGHHLFTSRQLIVKTYCKQMSSHSL